MDQLKKKKVEISVPEDLSPDVAQECFLVGLKTYLVSNSAGLCVSHGVEMGGETSLKMLSFRGEFAAAISKFCNGVFLLQSREEEMNSNLWAIRQEGSKILKELQDGLSKKASK